MDNITVQNNELDLNQSIQIYYKVPKRFFDYIILNCFANDYACLNQTNFMMNQAYNQSLSIYSSFNLTGLIRRGINYTCRIITNRQSFVNVSSEDFTVKTSTNSTNFEFIIVD